MTLMRELVHKGNVAFGSLADMAESLRNVRFTPRSEHSALHLVARTTTARRLTAPSHRARCEPSGDGRAGADSVWDRVGSRDTNAW